MRKSAIVGAAIAALGFSSLLASSSYQCDVNQDGVFDVLDVIVLQKFLLGQSVGVQDKKVFDINGDGCIDIFDLGLMKREWIINHQPEIITQESTVQPTTAAVSETTSETESLPTAIQVTESVSEAYTFSLEDVPAYSDKAWYVVDDNIPDVADLIEIYSNEGVFEYYASLDNLGRCGVTYASICQKLMPTEKRGEIGQVKPSGWQYKGDDGKWHSNNNKYDFVDGKYVYNRCHLIGFQLAGENANECNLITGTRYLNIDGMLPFENMVADYVHEQNNTYQNDVHVLYRVTPIYKGDNLVAEGVRMEGYSLEDQGDGICFDVFCYNVQPGVVIDYATGKNWVSD